MFLGSFGAIIGGLTGAIVGARNARQAAGVMRAGELRLTDEEVSEIEALLAETVA